MKAIDLGVYLKHGFNTFAHTVGCRLQRAGYATAVMSAFAADSNVFAQ